MRQMQKPALVQNETNAKATNNNFTQRFLLCHTEITEITEGLARRPEGESQMLRTPQYLQSK